MLDALSDIVCITAIDGTLQFLNRAGRDLLGYAEQDEALVGCLFPTHTPAARRLLLDEVIPAALRTGSATCDTALQTADGRVFPAAQTVIVTPASPSAAATLTIVVRDVSIERQAAARLSESQRLFEMIARGSPDLLFLYDPADERIVWTNRCPHAFLGGVERDARTLSRREVLMLVHPDDQERLRASGVRMGSAYGDSDVVSDELRVRTDGGEWRWVHTRASVFSRRETGAPLLLLGIATDITARKATEQQLVVARDGAERAARQSHAFLVHTADAFRAALHEIVATAAEVGHDRDRRLGPRDAAQLQAVVARGAALLGTVSDLDEFLRIEAGDMPVTQALADVRQVITDTVTAFRDHPACRAHPMAVTMPDAPAPALVDVALLRQALTQLIGLALGGTPHARVAVTLRVHPDAGRPWCIDVHEADAPLPEDARFIPLADADATASSSIRAQGSLGLSLAVARALCELMGCSVRVAPAAPPHGSTVRIMLPTPSRAAQLAAAFPGPARAAVTERNSL